MDWPTAIATVAPIGVSLVAGLRPVTRSIARLAKAAERIADRLDGADYVALPARKGRAVDELLEAVEVAAASR